MTLDTEVLVHVAAPSGARDDARYRALVESCLAFEPVSRLRVYGGADEGKDWNPDVTVEDLTSSLASSAGQSSPLPEINNDDDISFNSGDELNSLLGPRSPASRGDVHAQILSRQPPGPATHVPSTPIRYQSTEEESELSFRAPVPLGRQDPIEKTHSQSSKRETSTSSAVEHNDKSASSQVTQATPSGSSAWGTPLDTIPDSQPGTPQPEEDHYIDQTEIDDVQVDRSYVPDTVRQSKQFKIGETSRDPSPDTSETRVLSSMPSPGSPSRSLPATRASTAQLSRSSSIGKRKKVKNNDHQKDYSHSHSHTNVETPVDTTSSFSSDQQHPKRRQILPQTRETISLDEIPLEIRGPNPEVSNEQFRTHITPTLQALADRMKVTSRFTPSQQTRALHPLERGYWFIQNLTIKHDTDESETPPQPSNNPAQQIWSLSFFSQFWCFLRDFIVEGRAGWGIWCLVEECSSSLIESVEQERAASPMAKSVNLKIYTWGEVAPHVYMLLFLATERRIRKLQGVEWRDARDEIVIKM